MPKVTVGMPVYNGARFVREALDTLIAQEFKDFELVISDNASTDETPRILEEYADRDERIRIVRRPQTVMAYENFNGLVLDARGRYFTWAACDDLREPQFLSRLVEVLDTHPEVVIAYCNPRYFGDRMRSRSHSPSPAVNPPGGEPTPLARAIALLRVTGWLPVYGLIRTDALRRSRLFHYPMGIAADVGIVIELAAMGKMYCVPEVLMSTRLRADSLSMDLDDPIHFGQEGRRFDAGVQRFVEGLLLSSAEKRIFRREIYAYCRKAQKPRRGLWKLAGYRSLWLRTMRGLVDVERKVRGL